MSVDKWRIGMTGVSKQALIGVSGEAIVVPPPDPKEPPVMRFNAVTNSQLIALLEDF